MAPIVRDCGLVEPSLPVSEVEWRNVKIDVFPEEELGEDLG